MTTFRILRAYIRAYIRALFGHRGARRVRFGQKSTYQQAQLAFAAHQRAAKRLIPDYPDRPFAPLASSEYVGRHHLAEPAPIHTFTPEPEAAPEPDEPIIVTEPEAAPEPDDPITEVLIVPVIPGYRYDPSAVTGEFVLAAAGVAA